MTRLVFLGTPEAAVPSLEAVVRSGHQVALVVSRPDRRRGRGGATSASPVKQKALELGLEVTDRLAAVLDVDADLGIVAAYGRIIPVAILDRVPMLNVHFSLLPRWRGAAPVERALLAGDATTGVCIMQVEEGLDTGGVYARAEVPIGPRDSVAELRTRLATVGADLLTSTLAGVDGGGIETLGEPEPQRGEPTYAPKVGPSEHELRWDQPAVVLDRVVRLGRAHTTFRGRRLGVVEAVPATRWTSGAPAEHQDGSDVGPGGDLAPGTLLGTSVVTGDGGLDLVRVQPAGGRVMDARDWLRGVRPATGEALGPWDERAQG